MAYSPEARRVKYEKKKALMKVDPEFRIEQNRKRQASRRRRITAQFKEVGFDVEKLNTGICCYIECQTKLSKYNDDYCCGLHQKLVIKNGLGRLLDNGNTYGLGFKKQEL